MSKRRYSSVEFKAVDWHRLEQRLGEGRGVVAVDVAKEDFVASVFAADQSALRNMSMELRHQGVEFSVAR